jgi:transposase
MSTKKQKKRNRRQHTPEFKTEAVKLVLEQGLTRAEASRDLGVHSSVLGRWVNAAERDGQPGALSSEERDELRRLRRENKVLRMEREILKKAAVFFAKESR